MLLHVGRRVNPARKNGGKGMPQQGFLRVWKYKSGDLHHIQRHNERGPDTKLSADQLESIDQSLTHLNIIRLKSDKTFLERCEARIAEIDAERKAAGMRRMYHGALLTLACEFIISMADFMDRTPSREKQVAALDDAAAWLTKKFGGKEGRNVISVALHFDEIRMGHPHLHFVFVPVNDRNAVSASSMFSPTSLARLQNVCYDEVFKRYGLKPHNSAYEERNGELVKVKKTRRNLRTRDYRAACEARDEAICERDAAIADWEKADAEREDAERRAKDAETSLAEAEKKAAKARSEAESIVGNARTKADGILEDAKAEAKELVKEVCADAFADRKAAAKELKDAKASKAEARKLMQQAEAVKAAAESKAQDAERRVVDAAKLLGLCKSDDFAEAVEGIRNALSRQAAAWDRRMRRALSPERRRKAEHEAKRLRETAAEIEGVGRPDVSGVPSPFL